MSLQREYAAGDTRISPPDAEIFARLGLMMPLTPTSAKAEPVPQDLVLIRDSERGGELSTVSLQALAALVASLISEGGGPPSAPSGALVWSDE